MKNAQLYLKDRMPLSLGFLYDSNKYTDMDILDAVEDAATAHDLVTSLNKMNLYVKFKIDRITPEYVRLKGYDSFGNLRYFKAEFDYNLQVMAAISTDKIRSAERVLIDNGIDPDKADTVLQAIGYALLDAELYPE
jgi:hypothetical protein